MVAPTIALEAVNAVNTISHGAGLLAYLDVNVPPDEAYFFDVKLTTNTGKASICDVRLMSIGPNLCGDENITAVYTSTDSSVYDDRVDVAYAVPNINPSASAGDPGNVVSTTCIST